MPPIVDCRDEGNTRAGKMASTIASRSAGELGKRDADCECGRRAGTRGAQM